MHNPNSSSQPSSISRRGLLHSSLAAGVAVALTNSESFVVADEPAAQSTPATASSPVILFQGDSITDAGRDKNKSTPNDPGSLGRGYPLLIAGGILADHAQQGYRIYNKGISGNKVPDLENRWKADCLDIKPDILSILIGVNDIWHKLNGRYAGTVADYEKGFHDLLIKTQAELPKTRIVICEPFVLKCGAVGDNWFPEFDERREVANQLAADIGFTVVPFQQMFDKATQNTAPEYWAADGVHPTLAGHALMAKTWREVVGI